MSWISVVSCFQSGGYCEAQDQWGVLQQTVSRWRTSLKHPDGSASVRLPRRRGRSSGRRRRHIQPIRPRRDVTGLIVADGLLTARTTLRADYVRVLS
jgi:hypothetical protein